MNPEWLCYVNGQEYGPYTWPQLVQMAASGNVVPQTHVRRNFDSQWYLAEQVPGLFSPAVPAPAAGPKQAAHPATPPRTAAASGISTKKPSKSGAHPAVSAKTAPAQPAAALLPEPAPAIMQQPVIQQPVVQPAVPKGRVVSSKPAAAVADTKPNWIPVNPTAVSPAASPVSLAKATNDTEGTSPAKADKNKTMVLALGGAIRAVAILGGGALIWNMTRKPEAPKPIAAAPVEIPTTETDPSTIAAESNPTGEVNPAAEAKSNNSTANKTAATPAAKTETKEPTAPSATAANTTLLKSISVWKPIEKFSRIKIDPGLHCTKLNAYLAADEQGRKVAVRAEGGGAAAAGEVAPEGGVSATVAPATEGDPGAAPAIISPLPAAPAGPVKYVSAEAAPFLFVEVSITNPDSKPRTYSGWNNAETAALLIDSAGKSFTMLPPSATPNVKRQAAKELKPGETIQDTLVFAVPPTSQLLFRLALPKPAFSPKLNGAWSYEISGVALAGPPTSATPAIAGPGEAPLVPRSSTTIPIPGLQDVPPPQPAPQPAPEKPADVPEPEKKPMPTERIPIPGLTDAPEEKKPAGPKRAEEVPNLTPPPAKKN